MSINFIMFTREALNLPVVNYNLICPFNELKDGKILHHHN